MKILFPIHQFWTFSVVSIIAAVDKISRDIFTLLRDIDYILPEAKRQSRVSAILQKTREDLSDEADRLERALCELED